MNAAKSQSKNFNSSIWSAAVIVSALGYFVDIYDLLLFSVVRIASLKDLGVPEEQLMSKGLLLLNCQMIGLLIGGVVWGIWGDKKGRLSVLFGSIALYSIANIANGFVYSVEAYAFWRFIAGLGLAGELGAGITLVAESLPKEKRGYGTAIVASVGILGAVVASIVGDAFSWRTAYFIGGGLGLALLVLRVSVVESGLFEDVRKKSDVARGDLKLLFAKRERVVRYFACCCLGLPIWFVVGILITLSPELSKELQVSGTITAGTAVLYSYSGLAVGDLVSGVLSQYFGSRKKVLAAFITLSLIFVLVYVNAEGVSSAWFYAICAALGFSVGFWAVFVTVAAEQFGTNLRATVTTTVPNFVRGAVVPITMGFQFLQIYFSKIHSALFVGLVAIAISFISMLVLKETHGKDLDYLEE